MAQRKELVELLAGVDGERMLADVRDICAFGHRLSGGEGEARTQDFLLRRFRAAGAAGVERDPYPYTAFTPLAARVEVLRPRPVTIRAEPLIYTPSTPPAGLTAELCDGGDGTPATLSRLARSGCSPAGRIVLSQNRRSFEACPLAAAAGATAFILAATKPGGHICLGATQLDRRMGAIPAVAVNWEDAQVLQSLCARGPVTVQVHAAAECVAKTSANIIAVIPGRRPAARKLLVVAHLDSVWNGVHASDNASGLAGLLEMTRLLAAAGLDRTVELVAFSGEELGFWGSFRYLERRPDALRETAAVISFDGLGSTRPDSEVGVTPDLVERVCQLAAAAEFVVDMWSVPPRPVSDHVFFAARGVPTFWVGGAGAEYHTAADVPDRIDSGKLARQIRLAVRVAVDLDGPDTI